MTGRTQSQHLLINLNKYLANNEGLVCLVRLLAHLPPFDLLCKLGLGFWDWCCEGDEVTREYIYGG